MIDDRLLGYCTISPLKLTNVSKVLTATIIRVMIEAISTSQTFMNFDEIIQCNIPEGCHLHVCCHESLKFYFMILYASTTNQLVTRLWCTSKQFTAKYAR
jgi:hypothetical protein